MKAGYIYRIAGSPAQGYSGDGRRAILARLSVGVIWLDGFGNIVLGGGNRVRVIAARTGRSSQPVLAVAASTGTFYGQAMTAGDVYTIAGDGTSGFAGSGGPATDAEFTPVDLHLLGAVGLSSVAIGADGSLLVSDGADNRIRAIAP